MKTEEQSGKKLKPNNTLICVGVILLMLSITTGGLLFFKMQIAKAVQIEAETKDERQYEKYYAIVTSDNNSSFWEAVYTGAKEEAESLDICIEIPGNSLSVDYSEREQMEIAIESGVDGIIVEANESEGMRNIIDKAIAAGIPVVTAMGDNTASKRISYVGISSYNLGREYGKQILELAGSYFFKERQNSQSREKMKVQVLVNSNTDDSSQNIVFSGIQETVSNSGKYMNQIDLELKTVDIDGAFATEESIRDILMDRSTCPNVIVCLNELNTTCVYQAVVDYNMVGQIDIVGYYNSQTILHAIERGVIYSTIEVDARQMGEYCVNALHEYQEFGYVSEYYAVDTQLINDGNVSGYLGGDANEE